MPYKDETKQKAAQRRYYEENKDKYLQNHRERRNLLRRYVTNLKENTPCTDCGIQYPAYIMDFDHIKERGIKTRNIGAQLSNFASLDALKAEMELCDIVCANCHRHRTWMRLKKEISIGE